MDKFLRGTAIIGLVILACGVFLIGLLLLAFGIQLLNDLNEAYGPWAPPAALAVGGAVLFFGAGYIAEMRERRQRFINRLSK